MYMGGKNAGKRNTRRTLKHLFENKNYFYFCCCHQGRFTRVFTHVPLSLNFFSHLNLHLPRKTATTHTYQLIKHYGSLPPKKKNANLLDTRKNYLPYMNKTQSVCLEIIKLVYELYMVRKKKIVLNFNIIWEISTFSTLFTHLRARVSVVHKHTYATLSIIFKEKTK